MSLSPTPRDGSSEDAPSLDQGQESGLLAAAPVAAQAAPIQSPQALDPQGATGSASQPQSSIPISGQPPYDQAYFNPQSQSHPHQYPLPPLSHSPTSGQSASPAPPPPHLQYAPPPSEALDPSFRPVAEQPLAAAALPGEPGDPAVPQEPPAEDMPASFPRRRPRGPRMDLFPDIPRLRELGTELGRSRPDNGRMSGEMRAAILAAVAAGLPKSVVADCFNVGRRTVNITLSRFAHQGTNRDKPRSGRPRKLSDETERAIAGAGGEASATALARDYGVSVRTIKRIRRDYEIETGARPPRRPDGTEGALGDGVGGSGTGTSAEPMVEDGDDDGLPDVQSLAQH